MCIICYYLYCIVLVFVLYCPGPLTVIYNMYKSMTSRGVHLYLLFVLYSIYIYEISINKHMCIYRWCFITDDYEIAYCIMALHSCGNHDDHSKGGVARVMLPTQRVNYHSFPKTEPSSSRNVANVSRVDVYVNSGISVFYILLLIHYS